MPGARDLWDTLDLMRREAAARGDMKLAAMYADSMTRLEQEHPRSKHPRPAGPDEA